MSGCPTTTTTTTTGRYACSRCGKIHLLALKDAVRCTRCGNRIFYKQKTTHARGAIKAV